MSIDFLPPVTSIQEPVAASVQAAHSLFRSDAPLRTSEPGFGSLVTNGLQQVSSQLNASQADMQRLATGEVQNLHQVMIKLEESRLAFQMMVQVRNRLLESYQELMRMQV